MARQNIYIPYDVLNELTSIVEAEYAKGATQKDISISSLSVELMRLGLMVYKAQREDKSGAFDLEGFRKELLSRGVSTNIFSELMLTILMDIQAKLCNGQNDEEVIDDSISKTIEHINTQKDEVVLEYFGNNNIDDE